MSKNIEIQVNLGNDSYDILYPKINLTNNQGTALPISSTSGSISITDRTTGTLSLSRGGTGVTSLASLKSNLGIQNDCWETGSYIGTGTNNNATYIDFTKSYKHLFALSLITSTTPGYGIYKYYLSTNNDYVVSTQISYHLHGFFANREDGDIFSYYLAHSMNTIAGRMTIEHKINQDYMSITSVSTSGFTRTAEDIFNSSDTTYLWWIWGEPV